MIFKKPYAFFIKNFKLFHFILFVLSSFLLYRTSIVYSFIKEYVKNSPNVVGKELTDSLFVGYSYFLIVFMILINILLIIIMVKKVKPYLYYVVNIALYISVLVIFLVSHRVISDLEVMLVAPKKILAIRDFLNIARLLQTCSVLFYLIRATGFDIKKFDFGRDLHYLNISEEDSEEYEVAIEFEGNEIIRNIKRFFRNFKYYYKENKLIINIIVLLSISLLSLGIYLNIDKYSKVYYEQQFVSVGSFNMGVKASYLINNNYRNVSISSKDYDIIAVKLSVNTSYDQQLPVGRAVLVVDGYQYYHIENYSSILFDLGNVYNSQMISKDYSDYLLVYQIPKNHSNNIKFEYVDSIESKRGKTKVNTIDIVLNPIDLDSITDSESVYALGSEIDTSDSLISDYKIVINDFDISDKFVANYDACVASNECYSFKETLVPSVTANKEKVLLRLEGIVSFDNKISDVGDLYTFFKYFGSIRYTYDNKSFVETNDFNLVKFVKVSEDNTYYIEVDKELLAASDIKLVFTIRNNSYVYILKGE